MTDTQVSLADIILPEKSVWIDFPGFDGLSFEVTYLSRDSLIKLRKSCVRSTFDRRTHTPSEELDETTFLKKYTEAVVKNWKGFKWSYVKEFLLVDTSKLDPDTEMPYNQGNAEALVKNSVMFDDWLTDTISDLENFTKSN